MTNPIRPTDDDAKGLALTLVQAARHGALGVITSGTPLVTRVSCAWLGDAMHLLVSDLSTHTQALAENAACSLLVGEPNDKGDPLTHPRLCIQAEAVQTDKASLRDRWLALHPKAKLYIDFADFKILRLNMIEAHLNGGFGKAYRLSPDDFGSQAP